MPRIKVREKKLRREHALGQYYQGMNLIEIDPRQASKDYFLTIIHECLHAAFPDLSECATIRAEHLMGNTLWEQGYRKVML